MDELSNLADGDLTVTTTVSDDFTGAIADSVNYTIDQLRQWFFALIKQQRKYRVLPKNQDKLLNT